MLTILVLHTDNVRTPNELRDKFKEISSNNPSTRTYKGKAEIGTYSFGVKDAPLLTSHISNNHLKACICMPRATKWSLDTNLPIYSSHLNSFQLEHFDRVR